MPKRVKLPNGQYGVFPDDMGNDQIEAVLQKQFGAPQGPDLGTLSANINSPAGGAGYRPQAPPLPQTGFFAGVRQGASDVGGMPLDIAKSVTAAPQTTGESFLAKILPGNAALAAKRLIVDPMNAEAQKAQELQAQGKPYVGHAIASGIPLIGPFAAALGEQAGTGDVSGAAGRGLINWLAMKAAGSPEVQEGLGKMPISREGAVEKLTRSVNPPPQIKPGIRAQFSDQLDAILRSGSPKNQAELVNAIQGAMNADKYRQTFIEPYGSEQVAPPRSYQGAKAPSSFAEGRATINQLDARLSQINDTLYPKYNNKGAGSIAAEAQIGSEQAAALTSEATAIRNVLADELAKRTGVPRETIYKMRKNWGELNSLRQTAQLALDTSSMPSQAGVPLSRTGVLERAINRVAFKPAANRAIRAASSRYTPTPAEPITINETPFKAQQAAANERLFARKRMSELLSGSR